MKRLQSHLVQIPRFDSAPTNPVETEDQTNDEGSDENWVAGRKPSSKPAQPAVVASAGPLSSVVFLHGLPRRSPAERILHCAAPENRRIGVEFRWITQFGQLSISPSLLRSNCRG